MSYLSGTPSAPPDQPVPTIDPKGATFSDGRGWGAVAAAC
jgi:hypothetical protein